MSTLWVDVGDLFGYAGIFRRPSGIQRVVFELGRALAATDRQGRDVGFLRKGDHEPFVEVRWSEIAAMFAELSDDQPMAASQPVALTPARQAMQVQAEAWRALLAVPAAFRPPRHRDGDPAETATRSAMQPGDTLLVAGAGWSETGHAARIAVARQGGVRVALLVHDIIPLRRPEWFDPAQVARFRGWLDDMLAVSDRLLAVSASTAGDLDAYRRKRGLPACGVHVVRLGDGFSKARTEAAETPDGIVAGPYVLYVSTIEIRKNHAFLIDVWRALLDRMPSDRVPALVFAGREGALTRDLMRQLRASDCLQGKVVLKHTAGDADIAALYRGCAFTLFPSLYEGWGLPVAESLAFGKPCLASSTTSVPEVGGRLARYFNPLDLRDATAKIASLIADPEGLHAWEAEISSSFWPAPWSDTAQMVLDGIA